MVNLDSIMGFPPTWALLMMSFDVILGYVNAYLHREISSSKMRDGLMHKTGYFAMLIMACVAEGALSWCGNLPGFNDASALLGVFGVTGVSVYIIVMEVCSVMEIVGKLNPEIASSPLFNRMATNRQVVEQKNQDEEM